MLAVSIALFAVGVAWLSAVFAGTRAEQRRRDAYEYMRGAEARLDALSAFAHGSRLKLPARVDAVVAPLVPLTPAQQVELYELRGCGYTWEEIEAYAPMWGLDARAVVTEWARLEAALELLPTEDA